MRDHRLPDLLARCATLHDHLCPRQVLGVRMGLYAGELLDLPVPQSGKRLIAVVEMDGCFADGVAVATHCWLGHRTMRFVDIGRVAATFLDTAQDRAIRIAPSPNARDLAPTHAPDAQDRWHAYLEGYQAMATEDLLVATPVVLRESARTLVGHHSERARCETCGEEIFNGREVVVGAHTTCRACAGQTAYQYVRNRA